MAKSRTVFVCQSCGAEAPQWAGRCGNCDEWNTLVEEVLAERRLVAAETLGMPPVPISEIDLADWQPYATGIAELDRVLGGGLIPGSVSLVAGEPGIGKSTLLLQALASLAEQDRTVLYVSGEESAEQVRLRAKRLGALFPKLWFVAETNLATVIKHMLALDPDVVVIDSIQTMSTEESASSPGSLTQVRECAAALVQHAKTTGTAVVLVGHVTKEGSIAGPRVLEHVVDTVVAFEGERHHALRLLRAVKHRFGSTDELGLFEMGETGLHSVPDPSRLFLADRDITASGSVVMPTIEGHRPLLVEIQALVSAGHGGSPRRSAQGLDHGRMAFLLAVLQQRIKLDFSDQDVYALAVGGVKLTEPAADLALALTLASARLDAPLPANLVAIGEVGLAGEIRQVSQTSRRLAEAARLGFSRALVPKSTPDGPPGVRLIRVATLCDGLKALSFA